MTGPNGARHRGGQTGPDGGGRTGGRMGPDGGGRMGGRTGRGVGHGDGGDRWGAGWTGRIYTLSSIYNIWNLTNTIELKHLKTVAHVDNKF
jgi:hypothetical protein